MMTDDPMPNLLAKESSLYLRQHADQPVQWMPWGKAAFEKAKQEDKPIIVSIGYSSCHWCHVMSAESFCDDYVASIMNRHFICIKVDREERPDIDQTYLEAVRMFEQSAGWPLHAFCLPDGRPFWGGTYFPKEDLGQGIVPWPQLLLRISDHYRRAKEELIENGENIVSNLIHANHADCSEEDAWRNSLLLEAAHALTKSHDDRNGGFTPAPKFPTPSKIDFLLALSESHSVRTNPKLMERIDYCVTKTLDSMAEGSLFDHVGGGFFRYCVDEEWKTPHFEKMLCDNALLLSTYSRAFRKYGSPLYRMVVVKTLGWLLNEMGSPSKGFCSSVSADHGGKEGGLYLWSKDELESALGKEDAEILLSAYPSGSPDYLPIIPAKDLIDPERLEDCLQKLLLFRNESRLKAVSRDEKRITSWNALLLNALVEASLALQEKDWLAKACELSDWMRQNLMNAEGRVLSTQPMAEGKEVPGFLDDYAFWAEGLLSVCSKADWLEPGNSSKFLREAQELTSKALDEFRDEQRTGCFFSPQSLECPPPAQKKFWYDNAVPAGNSSMLRIFSFLRSLTGDEKWEKEYLQARSAYPILVRKAPYGIAHALTVIAEHEIGICSVKGGKKVVSSLVEALANKPHRPIFMTQNDSVGENKSTLCVGTSCLPDFEREEELLEALFGKLGS
tara:strand:- start:683 stop:2707 length:2025 start_codon:yes stop_codon:yes gene_type:complete